jgi:hypothetical protein
MAWAPRLRSQELLHGWSAEFPPNTLELVAVEQASGGTVLDLRNVSGKPITAFAVSGSDSSVTHAIDYFQAEENLAPGGSYLLRLGKREPAFAEHVLHLAAVIFADGTSQGVPDELDAIRGARLGLAFEVERVNGIVNAPADPIAADGGIQELKDRMGSLPQSVEEAADSVRDVRLPGADVAEVKAASSRFAVGFLNGVSNARQDAVWQLNRLSQFPIVARGSGPNRAAALFQVRQLYRSLSARYQILISQRGVMHQ